MDDVEYLSLEAALRLGLGPLDGLAAVDLGAGSGRVTRLLAAMGAELVGVEPNAEQVAKAEAEGAARYVVAGAEATGLGAAAFDLAVFSFSLHHVPDMDDAVAEARRVTRPGGRVVVIEPTTEDPLYPVMRFVDDEAAVYDAAQAALTAAEAAGELVRANSLRFAMKFRVETPDALMADLLDVDGGRRLAEADRAAFDAAFAAALRQDSDGGYIPHWIRMDVFTRP